MKNYQKLFTEEISVQKEVIMLDSTSELEDELFAILYSCHMDRNFYSSFTIDELRNQFSRIPSDEELINALIHLEELNIIDYDEEENHINLYLQLECRRNLNVN